MTTIGSRPGNSVLRDWYLGSFEEIARSKLGSMHADGFKYILAEFPRTFDCVKPLAEN